DRDGWNLARPRAPRLMQTDRGSVKPEGDKMRHKQSDDECDIHAEAKRPSALLDCRVGGNTPQRQPETELEIHEAPGKGQTVKKDQRNEPGDVKSALDDPFDRDRASDEHDLAQQIETACCRFPPDEPPE